MSILMEKTFKTHVKPLCIGINEYHYVVLYCIYKIFY